MALSTRRVSPETARDKDIAAALKLSCKRDSEVVRVLVVGAAQSGKTSIVASFERLYSPSPARRAYLEDVDLLVFDTLDKIGEEPWAKDDPIVRPLLGQARKHRSLSSPGVKADLDALWQNNLFQAVGWTSGATALSALGYWIEKADAIASTPTYSLGLQDDLRLGKSLERLRGRRPSVEETHVVIDGVQFHFINVEESLAFRRQNLLGSFFDEGLVTCSMYVVDMSTFDQTTPEGENVLEREVKNFDQLINNGRFKKMPFVLLLNKSDVLQAKLERGQTSFVSAAGRFADFAGDYKDVKQVRNYIRNMFLSKDQDWERCIYDHFTSAVSDAIQVCFNACKDTILRANLRSSGFMD